MYKKNSVYIQCGWKVRDDVNDARERKKEDYCKNSFFYSLPFKPLTPNV